MREPHWNSLAYIIKFFQVLRDVLETVAEIGDLKLEAYQDAEVYQGFDGVAKGHRLFPDGQRKPMGHRFLLGFLASIESFAWLIVFKVPQLICESQVVARR
jgi:hypothetical protein